MQIKIFINATIEIEPKDLSHPLDVITNTLLRIFYAFLHI